MPKVRCHAEKMKNDYLVLPGPYCIERDVFLPFNTMKFGGQDYCMKQPQKTLVYTKALQFWAEKAQLPMPGKPHQLAELVWELREAMEPLTTFTDEEVLGNNAPSHWAKITSSRISEPMEPASSWEWSHSRNRMAHAQGSFIAPHSLGRLKPTVAPQVGKLIPNPQMEGAAPRICGGSQVPMGGQFTMHNHRSPTRADHITRPLGGTATAMMISTSLCQDVALGTTYPDMVTISMSLVGLGATPRAVDHPMLTLEGWKDSESDKVLPPHLSFLLVTSHPESLSNCLFLSIFTQIC